GQMALVKAIVRLRPHGSKFPHRERPAVLSDSCLLEEDRSRRNKLDDDGNNEQQWSYTDERKQRTKNIQSPFPNRNRVIHSFVAPSSSGRRLTRGKPSSGICIDGVGHLRCSQLAADFRGQFVCTLR